MKNTWNLALANIRKGKGQATSLLIFVVIAALLLNMGLLLTFRFADIFDENVEKTHSAHMSVLIENKIYEKEITKYIKDDPSVDEVELSESLYVFTDIDYNDGKMPGYLLFSNADKKTALSTMYLCEGKAPQSPDEICLPLMFKTGGGYEIGDELVFKSNDGKITYKISGFTNEMLYGSVNNGAFQTYLSDKGYRQLKERLPQSVCSVHNARFDDPEYGDKLSMEMMKEFDFSDNPEGIEPGLIMPMTYPIAKSTRTFMSDLTSVILLMVSAIIVFVCLIVIRFRIRNHIEESMTNIGALKAVGYTGKQIILSVVIQFSGIAAVGVLLGIALTYILLPGLSSIMEQQSALPWDQGFDFLCTVITAGAILLVVLVVSWFSARRIRRLSPVNALRQGVSSGKNTRNHLSLDSSRGGLSLLLAVKNMFQSKGQMLMIFMIVAILSLASVAGISIYDNIGRNPDNFAKLVMGEMPDAAFFTKSHEDAPKVFEAVKKHDNTRKVFYYDQVGLMCGDDYVNVITVEDFDCMEGTMLYEGRYPKNEDEIAIGGSLARLTNKNIGDDIEIKLNDRKSDYRIVGLISTTDNFGMAGAMTHKGVKRIEKDFKPYSMYIYLNDNSKSADFIKSIEKEHSKFIESSVDMKEIMAAQLGMYASIFRMVAYAIIAVTAMVILLTLFLILKTVIIRRRREFGIQKAMGFTTFQLMNQISLGYIPVIALGVAAGGVVGILGFNNMFVALTKNLGIMSASMPSPAGMVVIMCVLLVLMAYICAMLISWRIRRISAYALVTE